MSSPSWGIRCGGVDRQSDSNALLFFSPPRDYPQKNSILWIYPNGIHAEHHNPGILPYHAIHLQVDVEVAVMRGVALGSWVGDGSGVEVDRAVGVCVGRGASGSQRTGTGFK